MSNTVIQDEVRNPRSRAEMPRRDVLINVAGAPTSGERTHADPPFATGVAALVSLWARLVLFGGGILVVLASIEGGLSWWVAQEPVAPTFDARQAAPYVEFYSEPNFHGGGVLTNEAGFRYESLPLKKPAGETRVFFLSSSVGFRGETNDTTIAGWMERLIKEGPAHTGRTIRVINASSTSFNSTQSLVLLVTRVLAYEPDIVVVFHGPESLLYPSVYESRPGYPFNFRVRERGQQRGGPASGDTGPVLAALRSLRLTQVFHPDLGRNAQQAAFAKHNLVRTFAEVEQYDPYIDVVCEDVEKIVRIALSFGCRTVVAVPPWRSPSLLNGAVERLADRVAVTIDRYGRGAVRYVDTLPLANDLTVGHYWQADGVHWADDGNRLVAKRLVEVLLSTDWLSSSPSGTNAQTLSIRNSFEDRK